MDKRKRYRGIDHPAVSAVVCPYCMAAKGTPCRNIDNPLNEDHTGRSLRRYVQTHKAREDKYESIQK